MTLCRRRPGPDRLHPPGDLVLSRDEHTGAQSLKRVVRTMVHQASQLVHVRTATDTITATPNHPFWVRGRGWVDAGDLASGDTLVLADGGRADIVSVTREKLASPVDVYNLEVEDYHTYFVASSGVWVHNCGGDVGAVTGRGAETLREQLSIQEAISNHGPGSFKLPIEMNDTANNFLSGDGWSKYQWIHKAAVSPWDGTSAGNINVHYLYNSVTGAFADAKIVSP